MLMWLALAGCSNSGIGDQDTAAPEPEVDTTELTVCALAGSWVLDEIRCGAFPIQGWEDDFGSASLEISANASEGGCDVVRTITGASCTESEPMRWVAQPEGDGYDVLSTGTRCDPEDCAFAGGAPCVAGSRGASTDQLDVSLSESSAELEVTDGQPDGTFVGSAPDCTLDVVTVWVQL